MCLTQGETQASTLLRRPPTETLSIFPVCPQPVEPSGGKAKPFQGNQKSNFGEYLTGFPSIKPFQGLYPNKTASVYFQITAIQR